MKTEILTKLAQDSGFTPWNVAGQGIILIESSDGSVMVHRELKKFAELIIEECLKAIDDAEQWVDNDDNLVIKKEQTIFEIRYKFGLL